jgi:7-dehydrocholesterol reductase
MEDFWGVKRVTPADRSAPTLWEGSLAGFTYFLFLFILLTHRAFRDDARCRSKYGSYWDKYCAAVPYKIVPYVL